VERLLIFAALAVRLGMAQVTVTGPEGNCGFSKLQPRMIAHYVERGAVTKVAPQYPPAAKADGVTGAVRVRVLVNARGLVERTCPEYVKDQARPGRNLVVAAEAAALQWTFDPNFGLSPRDGLRFNYAEGVLVFNFVLDESRKDASKHD
jgi:hypothetical protein